MVVLKTYPSSINGNEIEDDDDLDTMVSDSDSELESGSEDGEENDDIKLTEPSKTAINNKEGLLEKLSEIIWPEDADWMHKLSIVIDQEQKVDVNDDLAREALFYTQALQGTREAFAKIESKGIPYLRPSDYYAEMVKTDAHMGKVKSKLLVEKKQIEEQDERRKSREAKKISKQVQAEKMKERAKEKKDSIESVKKWRKQREKTGFSNDKESSFEESGAFKGKHRGPPGASPGGGKTKKFDGKDGGGGGGKRRGPHGIAPGDRSGGKAKQFDGKGERGNDRKRKSRDFKDSKFGYGGRKGGKKQNTAETTNDFKGFNKNNKNSSNSHSGNKRRKQF
ncbi:hypothetical protein SOVF_207440 [Spinacia oleracea]|uniref:Probable rRNA-processing protein EBP2 homolog n=1 Tax=Spinacia oleracea TaxID=3562 RepID=A0A9R0K3U8_SPIOL|nr:probable rRNA-processing protein EBP2 homolog [Spinacia oleracea]KNA03619.1 hypothetical protein SOVF_207440 [Spinacia oleracea]